MPPATAETLAHSLRPLTDAPDRAAIFCDVDGTLAPIVERAEQAAVPQELSRLLGTIGRRFPCVACVSGRSAAEARRLVGVGSIVYVGAHGAELLEPGSRTTRVNPAFAGWASRVHRFADSLDLRSLRTLRVRLEDKGTIVALHWRGAPDEPAAERTVAVIAAQAEAAGLGVHRGRKVLEVRPPVPVDKGRVVRELVLRSGVRTALFAGDDTADLDGFAALDALCEEGALDAAVRVGVASEDGPPAIVERADLVVDGVNGFAGVLAVLARA